MRITISLNDERVHFLNRCIQSGAFRSHDAVIDTALILMRRYAGELTEHVNGYPGPDITDGEHFVGR